MADQTIPRPGRAIRAAPARRRAVENLINIVRTLAEQIEPAALENALAHWQRQEGASRPEQEAQAEPLLDALTGGREYTPEEALLLELEAQRHAFARRRELLRGALTSTQVSQLLGTKRQTPHDRLRRGTLLGVEENGRRLFPYWQFDPNGPHGVVAGLPEALQALDIPPLGKVSWLTTPNPYLEGRTPLQALKEGDTERVIDQARAVGAL